MIAWRHYSFNASSGVARGYLSSAYFLYHILRGLLGPDLKDCIDLPEKPKIHLHYCPPHLFVPMPGKTNVLFTMWEGDVLPEYVITALKMADKLLVPSGYCKDVWAKHGLVADVVPLGVAQAFVAANTNKHEGTLRVLSVGSLTSRKGWDLLAASWEKLAQISPRLNAQLYVKTIGDGTVKRHFGGRVVIDQRDLEPSQMLKLYMSSHMILSTSYGEGFGLPILEGMATGCLAVCPYSGGLTEFVGEDTAVIIKRSAVKEVSYGETYETEVATADDVAEALSKACNGWGKEIEPIRVSGATLAKQFSWPNSGLVLLEALKDLG